MTPRLKRNPPRFEQDTVIFDVSTESHPDVWTRVDLSDWPRIQGHRWSSTKRKNGLYVRNANLGLLHRYVLNADQSVIVDHRDGDTLNNTRGNIRECSYALNNQSSADRRRGYGIITEKTPTPTRPHVVKKRLADGSVKEYAYPTRSKTGTKNIVRCKLCPAR